MTMQQTYNHMKKQLIIAAISMLGIFGCQAQSETKSIIEMKKIKATIHAFGEAGDQQNVAQLDKLLNSNYRIVMNRLFGSEEVSVMPRSVYMDKIRSKEFGGDKREVIIENIIVNNTLASAKVTMKGETMTFVSCLQLIQKADGEWQLISDMPYVVQ